MYVSKGLANFSIKVKAPRRLHFSRASLTKVTSQTASKDSWHNTGAICKLADRTAQNVDLIHGLSPQCSAAKVDFKKCVIESKWDTVFTKPKELPR